MEVSHNLSFLALISNASFLVQCVMAVLLGMSLVSWWYIFRKIFSIRETLEEANRFEAGFLTSS
ncbi:MAG: protein TolQ, partial [Burkholderiales bacterium]